MMDALNNGEEAFVVLRLGEGDFWVDFANATFAHLTGLKPSFERPAAGAQVFPSAKERHKAAECLLANQRCELLLTVKLRGGARRMKGVFFLLHPPYYAGLLREVAQEDRQGQVLRSLERVKRALDRQPADFYNAVLSAALASVPGAEAGSLWILQGDFFVCAAQVGHTPELIGFSIPFETELRWYGRGERSLRQGMPRIITRKDIEEINADTPFASLGKERFFQASLLLPVVRKGEIYGTFNLDNFHSQNAFSEQSIEAGRLFAEEIVGFLETEQREQRLRNRLELLERIVEINRSARSARSQGQLYLNTLDSLKRYIGSKHASILLLQENDEVLRVAASTAPELPAGTRIPRDRGASWIAVEERRLVYIPDIYRDPRVFHFGEQQHGPVALLAAPLTDGTGKAVGVITANSHPHQPFGEAELAFFEATAEAVGTATERLKALGEATRRAEAYRKLIVLSTQIEVLESPENIAERALRTILELTPFEAGVFYTLKEDQRLQPKVLVGDYPSVLTRIYEETAVRLGEGLVGSAIASRHGGHVHEYRDFPAALTPFVEIGTRSVLAEPLWVQDQPYGGLALVTFTHPAAAPQEARYLVQLTARRIERAFERIGHLSALEEAREAMLRAFGVALEQRDYETHGHTERVARISVRLARALGIGGKDLEALRWGAYLHDIGKLAIPDHVLLKEGPLDDAEWELMRKHTEIGYQMLEPIPFLPDRTRNIVRYHHEHWDGSGYPQGLAGTDIPLEARLFAVVDVFDALTNDRPYKRGWSVQEVARELRDLSGSHLDPHITHRFLNMIHGLHKV